MKKFRRHITLDELSALCAKHGWKLNRTNYDRGSDFVNFIWRWRNIAISVVYSSFNGRFLIKLTPDGPFITECSDDNCAPWFPALLRTIYTNKRQPDLYK